MVQFWFDFDTLACHKDSETYHYAHSLSQERLEKIYLDFKKYALEGKEFKGTNRKNSKKPTEFEDLIYKRLFFYKFDNKYETAVVRLKFCFDNAIDLEVEGLQSENPIIYLAWGELERTKEILWKKN